MKVKLKIAWASHEAAKFACETWHYTGKIPVNKLVKVGAWEDERFIGVVVFGMGASAVVHRQFGLDRFQVCELVRVALDSHLTPVSRIIAIALKFLKEKNPGLRVCVSFADPAQGHHGGIYQAGNWIYTGETRKQIQVLHNQRWTHIRSVYHRIPNSELKGLRTRQVAGKLRYVMPFDKEMREKISDKSLPYPKRAPEAEASMRPSSTREIGGSSPTSALQLKKGIKNAKLKRAE